MLHYSDGTQAELPIVYGEQVRDWWATTGAEAYEAENARAAWKGSNPATARQNAVLRVFESTRDNPPPERCMKTIDFVSSMTDSAPFLIAITLE